MAFGGIRGTKTGTLTSITASFPCATGTNFAVVVGDLIVALCSEQTTVTATACADNLGNTYSAFGAGLDAGTVTGRAFWTRVTNPGTITTVTFTATASANNCVGLAVGFEGPFPTSPIDAAPAGIVNDNTTPYTCPPTGTLAQANELVVCAIIHNGNPTFTATSPNTIAVQLATASVLKAAIGYQVVSSTASVTPAFTASATPTASAYDTVSFKQGSVSGDLATTGSPDAVLLNGTVAWPEIPGDLATSDVADTADMDGDVAMPPITGNLAVSDVADTAGMSGTVLTADAWSAVDKSSNFVLSNGDKTATLSTAVTGGVRSTTKYLNGTETRKFYVEFFLTNAISGFSCQVGVREVSAAINTSAGSTFQCATNSGNIVIGSSTTVGNIGGAPLLDGDVVCLAWSPSTERGWFRKNGGLWNNDAAANPATNTNGFDISALNNTDHALLFLAASSLNGASVTVRTKVANLTYTIPSGFVSWMGEAVGNLAVSDVADTLAATGTVAWPEITGDLAIADDIADTASMDGTVADAAITGDLAVSESADAAAMVGAAVTADAWNAADKSANIALSNSDKRATFSAAAVSAVRSSQLRAETAGKYYAEFKIEVHNVASADPIVGIIKATGTVTSTFNSAGVRIGNGQIYIQGSTSGQPNIDDAIAGDVVCVAWDGPTQKIWFRVNAGNWNASATANPETGAEGVSTFLTGTFALWLYGLGSVSAGDAVTVRTEAAEFTQAAPTGFLSWMGEAGEITGTVTVTEPADTASLTGDVVVVEDIEGDLAASETADTAALAGSVVWLANLAATDPADAAALTGSAYWLATLAATETADAFAAIGTVFTPVVGTLVVTESADTFSATGTVLSGIAATLAVTEPADTLALTGQVTGVTGDLAASETADAFATTGSVYRLITLATTEAADTANATGSVYWLANLATTEPRDIAAVNASVYWLANLAVSEAKDTFAATGVVFDVLTGTLAVTEAADSFASTGTVLSGIVAYLQVEEPADTAAITGQVTGIAGAVGAIESRDGAAFTGSVRMLVNLAAAEAPDAAALTGAVFTGAALAATEAADIAAFAGPQAIPGALAAVEAADTASLTGGPTVAGLMVAFEAADGAAFTGGVLIEGDLAVTEAPDYATIEWALVVGAWLEATDRPDIAAFTSAPPNIQEAKGHILGSALPRVRAHASAGTRVRSLQYPVPRPRTFVNTYGTRERDVVGGRNRTLEVE